MKPNMSLFLIAIAAAGVFALPSVLATFAGSHTMEKPASGQQSLDCTKCHQYIVTELSATSLANSTLGTHKKGAIDVGYMNYMYYGQPSSYNGTKITITDANATSLTGTTFIAKGTTQGDNLSHANDTLYIINGSGTWKITASWTDNQYIKSPGSGDYREFYRTGVVPTGNFALKNETDRTADRNLDGIIEDAEVCQLCHYKGYFGVNGTHTGFTVVGCTNDNCHGNSNVPGKAADYYSMSNIGGGYQISRKQEAHSNFYYGMKSKDSAYVSNDGNGTDAKANLSADYYTCLACHTHVGMTISIKRPAAYDVGISKINATLGDYKDSSGAWVESLEINHTVTNIGSNDVFGANVTGVGLNSSDITIIKDPTSAWMSDIPGKQNKWNK